MKKQIKIILRICAVWMFILTICCLSACSTAIVEMKSAPVGRSEMQIQLDNLECHNYSKTTVPWLFGFGYLISYTVAKARFKKCMENKGYIME